MPLFQSNRPLRARAAAGIAAALACAQFNAGAAEIDFTRDVEPILKEHCLDCHGPDKQKSEFRVDRRSLLLAGGDLGEPSIIPGKPDESFLIQAVSGEVDDMIMPPKGAPLSAEQISTLRAWIAQGAPTPPGYGPDKERSELTHWSLKPVRRPEPPSFQTAIQGNEIDAFIRSRLDEKGLSASSRAERRNLIRRLGLVMHGLPPSAEEADAFINDSDPRAWLNLVNNALESPRYGERWAQHWLDLVRFGETHGFETNRERPNAWPYRDWVIDAFNSDKPYDRFVMEQIAGDMLGEQVGVGFLVAGPHVPSAVRP